MEKCTRIGCGATFDPSDNASASCTFHPGAPLFHEGLKSYTCCKDTNRAVTSFDEFLRIPGCTTGSHSSEANEVKAPVVTANVPDPAQTKSTASQGQVASTPQVASASHPVYRKRPSAASKEGTSVDSPAPAPGPVEDQDPPDAVIPAGTPCKRLGCHATFDPVVPRSDDECVYHPLPAIFHEGSKGYACCKRRVLEFDEFLKIEGCKRGKHCFVGRLKESGQEEVVNCRTDMYQTPTQVICSVFGKGADKDKAVVKFEEWDLHVDLQMPGPKRFKKTYQLYGPVDPGKSTFRVMGTKVEITLVKADGRSWPTLEASEASGRPAQAITFGVTGRTGTVGGKQMVYNGDVVQP